MTEDCPLCWEPVSPGDARYGQRIGGLAGNRIAHRECLLRTVIGGIGHLTDHAYWCTERHDPDGGRTYRQSALEVDEWINQHGLPSG